MVLNYIVLQNISKWIVNTTWKQWHKYI